MSPPSEGKPQMQPPGRLRAVTAANGSAMTGPGTTTYLLGEGEVTVIDPGPDDPAHLAAILATLAPAERIGTILVTHPHLDHSALVHALAAQTGARVLGFGPAGSGRSPLMQHLAKAGLPGGGEGVDLRFAPDVALRGGEVLQLGAETLSVLHTPGHMAEHLAFGWADWLFCGDLVMGWAPSLVSPPDGDMASYLATLERLAPEPWTRLLPTHGAAIPDPARRIAELIAHRRQREAQILSALAPGPQDLAGITGIVYHDTAPALHPAASRNALAHLIALIERNRVKASPWPSATAVFSLA